MATTAANNVETIGTAERVPKVTLTGGAQMPQIGLGTWKAAPEEVQKAVDMALELGYRHFDTAFNYGNEEAIGEVLNKWIDAKRVKREELFITTKLPSYGNRAEDVEKFLKKSLERLKLNYVDLYLIHMPFGFLCDYDNLEPQKNEDGSYKVDENTDHSATWTVMEEQVRNGLTKNIGLSNFNADQLRKIHATAQIKPVVLQVEIHPFLQQRDLQQACKELNVALTAYAPLGSPGAKKYFAEKYNFAAPDTPDLLTHPTLVQIAEAHAKTPGQIMLRHHVQRDLIVIPKSVSPKWLQKNIEIFDFELTSEEIEKINKLDAGEKGRMFTFLFWTGVEKHKHYPFQFPRPE